MRSVPVTVSVYFEEDLWAADAVVTGKDVSLSGFTCVEWGKEVPVEASEVPDGAIKFLTSAAIVVAEDDRWY